MEVLNSLSERRARGKRLKNIVHETYNRK